MLQEVRKNKPRLVLCSLLKERPKEVKFLTFREVQHHKSILLYQNQLDMMFLKLPLKILSRVKVALPSLRESQLQEKPALTLKDSQSQVLTLNYRSVRVLSRHSLQDLHTRRLLREIDMLRARTHSILRLSAMIELTIGSFSVL